MASGLQRARDLGSAAAAGVLQWYGKMPLGGGLVVGVCTGLQVFNTVVTVPGCLSGAAWLGAPFSQLYTLFMSHFLHTGWFHLLFNMLAFAPFAGYQERNMGTYPLLHIILLLCATTSIIYIALTFVAGILFKGLWTGCVAGLSGVIFALISLEANKGDLQTQDFFGVKVPGAMFPWFLLIVTQFMFMSSSFFGHLSGILAGVLYSQGVLDKFFPGPAYFHRLESTPALSFFHGFPTFVPQPGGVSLPTYMNSTPLPTLSPSSATVGGAYYQRSSYTGYGAVNGGNTAAGTQDRTALLSDGDV
ncbi:hypothetical protein BDR26DRAFT_868614 [Obelidium mucronatum]|nr:hypothetical protein BDR26DRAFT_868614 [Obelidium mucronatum]